MIDDPEGYLAGIISEIERVKSEGGSGVLRANVQITSRVAKYVKAQLEQKYSYNVNIRPCARCNKGWTIIVQF